MTVNGLAEVQVIEDKISITSSPAKKAFLRVTFDDGRIVDMTLSLAQMIGGVAIGTASRLGYS